MVTRTNKETLTFQGRKNKSPVLQLVKWIALALARDDETSPANRSASLEIVQVEDRIAPLMFAT